MAILDLIQNVCRELGIKVPDSVVGSSNVQTQQLLELVHRAGKDAIKERRWPQLVRLHTITLADGDNSYAMPTDFSSTISGTHWSTSSTWAMLGPLNPQEWQEYQYGTVSTGPRTKYRVKGFADDQFFVDPTPGSGDAGNTLVFEYITDSWCKPKDWAATTAFAANSYCFYNGNYYMTVAGGTTGSTAPTHTSGSDNDGGVDWVYQDMSYDRFLADTDETHLNQDILELDVVWRMRRARGLEYMSFRADCERLWDRELTALNGAPVINFGRRRNIKWLTTANLPDSGYGQ